jgi:hypothetical protein
MGSVFELNCKYVDRSPQVGWFGLKKLDSGTDLDSGTELDSEINWKKNLRVENSKVQIDYLVNINLIGKRVKKTSDRDIYRPDYIKIITERYKVYEG